MKTAQLIELLNNPSVFKVNKYPQRAYKKVYSLDEACLEICLNGSWDFAFYEDILKRNENFMNEASLDAKIIVPGHIELQDYSQIQYVNTQYPWDGIEDVEIGKSPIKTNYCGQYLRQIEIDECEMANRYIMCFEGVESAFNLWVNGQYVGYSTDSFTTAEFEVSKYIKSGVNTIAVEVYKYSASSWLEDQDFWRFSGIFRDVVLKEISDEHIEDFLIEYDIVGGDVEGKLDLKKLDEFTVELTILDGDDNQIFNQATDESSIEFKIESPILWNAEQPTLYKFIVRTASEQFIKKIGFRSIKIENKVIKLNDKRIVFKGINRHEFDAYKGRAIGYEEIKKDLTILKQHNFNAIRTAHYPNNNLFYELCDEMGFYVISETNLETHGTWMVGGQVVDHQQMLPNDDENFRENVLQRAINMYERDKNNTSIVIWSLGNESYGGKTLLEMNEYFKRVDKTRLTQYEGVYWDRRYPQISDIESQMYIASDDVEQYLKDCSKPFILCEYTHCMGNSNGNLNDYLQLEDKYEQYQGGFIWEYMDQALYKNGKFNYGGDFDDRPTDYYFICDGLVGPDRELTSELKHVANLFSPIKIEETEDKFIISNKNTFATLNELIVKISSQSISGKTLIDTQVINLDCGESYELKKLNKSGVVLYEVLLNNKLLKEFSEVNFTHSCETEKRAGCKFVDGESNFSLSNENFQIMFSKITNNLISLKYSGDEVFESIEKVPKPNFWRAPTNNDIGAQKDKQLAIWKMIGMYQQSKITSYKFEDSQLCVEIEFTSQAVKNYKTIIKYVVSGDGEVKIETQFIGNENFPELFGFGLIATLNERYKQYQYLGAGGYDTYVDRTTDVVKKYNTVDISEHHGYLYPQEFGNHTNVNVVKISDLNQQGLMIHSDQEFEFSLKQYSDEQLELVRNRQQLVREAPELKLNYRQSGVGGDDSWGSWCKKEYRVCGDKNLNFEVTIKPLR